MFYCVAKIRRLFTEVNNRFAYKWGEKYGFKQSTAAEY